MLNPKVHLVVLMSSFVVLFAHPEMARAEPPNMTLLKTELVRYHDSGTYERDLWQIARKMKQDLALEKARRPSQRLAIVFDIDETLISNYPSMRGRDFANDRDDIHRSYLRADAPPLSPMRDVYHYAKREGMNVFFISGREERFRQATEANLRRAGYDSWDGLMLKPSHYRMPSVAPFKATMRKKIEEAGYLVVANVGDQTSDLEGGAALHRYKVPNPYYFVP